jgi:hypothetical protein
LNKLEEREDQEDIEFNLKIIYTNKYIKLINKQIMIFNFYFNFINFFINFTYYLYYYLFKKKNIYKIIIKIRIFFL